MGQRFVGTRDVHHTTVIPLATTSDGELQTEATGKVEIRESARATSIGRVRLFSAMSRLEKMSIIRPGSFVTPKMFPSPPERRLLAGIRAKFLSVCRTGEKVEMV